MKNKNMKKHITDLRNALYNHDLTVASEEDSPAFPATWTLTHPYFTLPMTIAFYNVNDISVIPLHESFGCYLMEQPEISLYFTKTNRHSWQRDLTVFIKTLMQYIHSTEAKRDKAVQKEHLNKQSSGKHGFPNRKTSSEKQ